jgi:beta-glucosidase-like glycosyl hydrolase
LLGDTVRGKWGFQGYITGDCAAVDDVQNTHNYTTNSDDTCHAVLAAGTDVLFPYLFITVELIIFSLMQGLTLIVASS